MRITNDIRRAISAALISHAFDARSKEMRQRENELALRLYRMRITSAFEAKCDRLEEEARDLLNSGDALFSYSSVVGAYVGKSHEENLSLGHQRVWADRFGIEVYLDEETHQGMIADVRAFAADKAALKTAIDNAKAQISATIDPIFTADKLRAAWPEARSIIDPILELHEPAPKQPLVVATEGLNVVLGLPAEERELEAA